jgi:hypothetical protein
LIIAGALECPGKITEQEGKRFCATDTGSAGLSLLIVIVTETIELSGQEKAASQHTAGVAMLVVCMVDYDLISDGFQGFVVAHFFISFGWVMIYTTEKPVYLGPANER